MEKEEKEASAWFGRVPCVCVPASESWDGGVRVVLW